MAARRWLLCATALELSCVGPMQTRQKTELAAQQAREARVAAAIGALVQRYGAEAMPRIRRGVDAVAVLWQPEDGDLTAFAVEQFAPDSAAREALFQRLESSFEQLDGSFLEAGRALRWPSEVDVGQPRPIDGVLASFDPGAHLADDLFASKIAFTVLLNFPPLSLKERLEKGEGLSRQEWAQNRLALRFVRRVPASVQQAVTAASAQADSYIASYNLWMHHVLGPERLFPQGLRLVSHWNLRDELKADYADPVNGVAKQRTLIKAMERIVEQSIPLQVIDNPRVDWDPFSNSVSGAPPDTVEGNAPPKPVELTPLGREPDRRYQRILDQFHAAQAVDRYSPHTPTQIDRSFELSREMPEGRVVALLQSILQAPAAKAVAAEIAVRLGRQLEPQDLWYNGFQSRSLYDETSLDAKVRQRYPALESFSKDLPRILQALGFSAERSHYVADRIRVDPARGAGHAMQAARRGDFPRLRTRVGPNGMDYKGYNIAIHELGHNVEQVFSLYDVDHTLLAGVPNTAFTEALAFVFQSRDLALLGLVKADPAAERARVLSTFWQAFEIAGVALVDIKMWHWLYEHPTATAAELNTAVQGISREVWNRYYAELLGGRDSLLLGVYSHMVAYPLYLPDYPLGHLIAFQIEQHLKTQPKLGAEFERMAKIGAIAPDLWMKQATGAPVSAEPLLRATAEALQASPMPH